MYWLLSHALYVRRSPLVRKEQKGLSYIIQERRQQNVPREVRECYPVSVPFLAQTYFYVRISFKSWVNFCTSFEIFCTSFNKFASTSKIDISQRNLVNAVLKTVNKLLKLHRRSLFVLFLPKSPQREEEYDPAGGGTGHAFHHWHHRHPVVLGEAGL